MLIIHPETKNILESIEASPPNAMLLEGPVGVGLLCIAENVNTGSIVTIVSPTDIDGNNDPEKGTIRVAQIRSLYEDARTKQTTKRVFILDNAERMNIPAQNAFLKLLEEPGDNVHFILTSHHHESLLPTIRSRAQRFHVREITSRQTKGLLDALGVNDQKRRTQLLYLADGKPALLTRLVKDDSLFSHHASMMTDARTLLQGASAERARVVFATASDRAKSLELLEACHTIITHSLRTTESKLELAEKGASLMKAYESITANGNPKLHLLAFVLK